MSMLKHNIVKHLESKGTYDPTVDDYQIDILIDNVRYADEMKRDLDERGCVVSETNGNRISVTKMNPSFGIYQMCLRNIKELSTKLGINRADRLKLKLIEEQKKDDFDTDFS